MQDLNFYAAAGAAAAGAAARHLYTRIQGRARSGPMQPNTITVHGPNNGNINAPRGPINVSHSNNVNITYGNVHAQPPHRPYGFGDLAQGIAPPLCNGGTWPQPPRPSSTHSSTAFFSDPWNTPPPAQQNHNSHARAVAPALRNASAPRSSHSSKQSVRTAANEVRATPAYPRQRRVSSAVSPHSDNRASASSNLNPARPTPARQASQVPTQQHTPSSMAMAAAARCLEQQYASSSDLSAV